MLFYIMDRQELYDIVTIQQNQFRRDEQHLIPRGKTEKAIRYLKTKMPLVITGVRRCGKSTLLKLIIQKLQLKEKEVLYINFNDERLLQFTINDFQKIEEYIKEYNYSKNTTILIDEIQETEKWEKWIDRIKDEYRIIITGSNSRLLSSELSTILTGRTLTITLYPFSFKEFLNYANISYDWIKDPSAKVSVRKKFTEYLQIGGFPKRITEKEDIILIELYENIVYKDIISRFSKNQSKTVKETLIQLISNIGKPLSIRNLAESTKTKNLNIIQRTIETAEQAFLIYTINKFDYSVRKQIQNPKKIYCVDNGIITTKSFRTSENNGQLLENMIFLELKRRGLEIYYHKNKKECDFVIRKGHNIIQAIQVCYALHKDDTDREINGLMEAMEQFKLKEGLIITFDQEEALTKNKLKIKVIPAWKWLLQT